MPTAEEYREERRRRWEHVTPRPLPTANPAPEGEVITLRRRPVRPLELVEVDDDGETGR